MSYTRRQDDGGEENGFQRPHPPPLPIPFNPNCTDPFNFPCLPPSTTINTSTVTTLVTVLSLTTISTSTISSNFISTVTTLSLSVTPVILPPDSTVSSALAAETSLLKSNADLTRNNIAIGGALGAFTIILIFALAAFFFLWYRRRKHRNNDSESPPFTSMAAPNQPVPAPSIRSGVTGPFVTQQPRPITALSTGPSGQGYGFGAAALKSHPVSGRRPAVAKRSSSAPDLKPPSRPPRIPTLRGLPAPAINIMPNTPSMHGQERDSSPSPVDPVVQQGADRMPMYHEALQEEAEAERSRRQRENAGRLGLPVVERSERRSQRASVSTIGSELERFAGPSGGTGGNTPARHGVLHSTRASSGVFPNDGEEEEEESSESRRASRDNLEQ